MQTNCFKVTQRPKRYVAFPKGSLFSVAICMTAQMGVAPGSIFTEALNWSLNYDLSLDAADLKLKKEELFKRNRRDAYEKMEKLLYSMGYDGTHCVLKWICESFASNFDDSFSSDNLFGEIYKTLFRYNLQNITNDDDYDQVKQYDYAVAQGIVSAKRCEKIFLKCPFSAKDFFASFYF